MIDENLMAVHELQWRFLPTSKLTYPFTFLVEFEDVVIAVAIDDKDIPIRQGVD